MKIGIIGCVDYPDYTAVRNFIGNLQFMYRPFGNLDDEYEEPIEIISCLQNNLDCSAVIAASKCNFKVRQVDSLKELIEESDSFTLFLNGNHAYNEEITGKVVKARKYFEVIFNKKGENNG
jgi:hypothetical protein